MKKHIILTAVSSFMIIGACLAHDTFFPSFEMTTTAILALGEIFLIFGNIFISSQK